MELAAKSPAELAQFKREPALAEWVERLLETNKNLTEDNHSLVNKAKTDTLKIQALTLELAYYRRIRFANKSEQFTAEQRELFEESWNAESIALDAEVEQLGARPRSTRRQGAGRQPLPDHLPRIEHRHEPEACTCGQCGKALIKMGEDVTEQLDVEPARFFVHRHIRPQYACRLCETITAPPHPRRRD